MCSINCIYSPVNKGFIDEISYLRSHNRFESTCKNNFNYTDIHNVDEDLRAISLHGGDCGLWWGDTMSGVFLCVMGEYSPAHGLDNVASLKNNHTLSLLRKSV